MKYVFLAIFVLLAAQPMRVSPCDMHAPQQTSHHGSHDMDNDHGKGMDCCDHDPSVPADGCDSMSHCGACPSAVMAFSSVTFIMLSLNNSRMYLADTGEPLSKFDPPLFKPPIA
jgi:hypothetical protein